MELEFDVTALPASDHPSIGEQAPDFTRPLVNDEYWEDTALSELTADGPVLLVFYPMDGSFPATYIWNELRERAWDADTALTIVGCSISTPYTHMDFIDDRNLSYRLFSDPANDVARQYGVTHELDGMNGVSEPRPAVFLIDTEMTVQYAWSATEWPEFPPYDAVETAVNEL